MKKVYKVYKNQCTDTFLKLEAGPLNAFVLKKIPYDILCGKHSGFPDCCIKFFITKWTWLWGCEPSKFRKAYSKRLKMSEAGYVPCPKCLKAKKFVDVQPCPKTCKLRCFVWGKDWWKK